MLHQRYLAHTSSLKFQIKSCVLSLWCSSKNHGIQSDKAIVMGFLTVTFLHSTYSWFISVSLEWHKSQATQFCAGLTAYTCVAACGAVREILGMCKTQPTYSSIYTNYKLHEGRPRSGLFNDIHACSICSIKICWINNHHTRMYDIRFNICG